MGERMKKYKLFQNSHGHEQYNIENGAAKGHICKTHEHGQWCEDCLREQVC